MKTLTKEHVEVMAQAAEIAYKAHMDIWKTAMRGLPINSKEYRDICAAGKKTRQVHEMVYSKAFDILGEERADKLMPSHTVGCGFN